MRRAISTASNGEIEYPLAASVGAAIRITHRAFAQDLQAYLVRHHVTVGMWFFLRTLWEEDGLTQRELSRRVGTMESTTVQQLRKMELQGLIERRRSTIDRRKVHVHLTGAARGLRAQLLPYAEEVNRAALAGLTPHEVAALKQTLTRIRANLQARQVARENAPTPVITRRGTNSARKRR